MATFIGIGFSQNPDTFLALREASAQARRQINQPPCDLVLVFNTIHYNSSEVHSSLKEIWEETPVIGSSTAGIILRGSIASRGVAILAIRSDEIKFGTGSVSDVTSPETRQAGNLLARNTIASLGNHPRKALLFFTDGLLKNSAPIIKGMQEVLGTFFPMVGAGSSDDFHFKKTFQYGPTEVMTSGAAGLLIGGQINLSIGSQHGWKPLGRPRIINQTDGHIIKTIDGKKASSLYEEYFGKAMEDLRAKHLGQMAILYPLGIYLPEDNEYLLRNAIDILDDGSIVCQGEVPEGSEVHIMLGNKESCKQAARHAALEVKESLKGKEPQVVLIFESLARNKLLGRGAFQEIELIKEILGHKTPLLGMYSYGEIAPFNSLQHIKKTHLQNASIVILAIG